MLEAGAEAALKSTASASRVHGEDILVPQINAMEYKKVSASDVLLPQSHFPILSHLSRLLPETMSPSL